MGFVLSENEDLPDSGIDTIGQRKVNDPEFAAKRRGGFCPDFGEIPQPRTAPAAMIMAMVLRVRLLTNLPDFFAYMPFLRRSNPMGNDPRPDLQERADAWPGYGTFILMTTVLQSSEKLRGYPDQVK